MAKLMLHRQILRDFHKLPSKVQKRISEWIELFQKNPKDPSIGLHSVAEGMADPKVRGADLPGGYRAIIIAPDKGDTYLLVYVDAHDKAYDWARNKRFEVHEMTGLFQVFDAQEVQAVVQERHEPAAKLDGYPLGKLSDDDLFKAGVPKPLIAAVKAIHSDESLTALSDYLPPDCRDVLCGIAAGLTLDQALEEMLGLTPAVAAAAAPDSPGDFTKLEKSTNFDLIQFKDEEELKNIFKGSLEEWRIFLHPYQRKLVEWQTNGPMNISGAAGTGKTVALMHRAVHLARRLAVVASLDGHVGVTERCPAGPPALVELLLEGFPSLAAVDVGLELVDAGQNCVDHIAFRAVVEHRLGNGDQFDAGLLQDGPNREVVVGVSR